jgi:hypothetical protein
MDAKPAEAETDKKEEKVSFWKTFPGVLTGIAAIITASAALLAAADKAGLIRDKAPTSADSGGGTGAITTQGDGSPVIQNTQGNVTIEDRE